MSESYWGFQQDSRHDRPRGQRRLLIAGSILLGVAILALSYVAVRGAQNMQQIMGLQQQAAEEFGALNREFGNAPARSPVPAVSSRWAAMGEVRAVLQARLGEDGRELFKKLEQADGGHDLLAMIGILPRLNTVLDRLLPVAVDALRSREMSPREYQTLLAAAVAAAIQADSPAGAHYRELLGAFAEKSGDDGAAPTPRAAFRQLNLQPEAAGTVPAATLESLDESEPAMRALDLLIVATRGMDIEALERKHADRSAQEN